MSVRLRLLPSLLCFTLAAAIGCGHKSAPPAPPAPPPSAAPAPAANGEPAINLTADPTAIQRGGNATLNWTSNNAIRVELNGAAVNLNGSQVVSPVASTDYQMVARSADGRTASATAHITVTAPPPPAEPVAPAAPMKSASQLWQENVRDGFFDYDKYTIRADAQQALLADAQFLKSHPEFTHISIEGHCDDRGSAQYNQVLGDRRANSVRDFFVQQGIDPNRITTLSYGKDRPYCTEDTEDCWQQNRRAAITTGGQ